jgi:serine/threonine protein kinase
MNFDKSKSEIETANIEFKRQEYTMINIPQIQIPSRNIDVVYEQHLERYTDIKIIKQCIYGYICTAVNVETKKEVCIKMSKIHRDNNNMFEDPTREINLMVKLSAFNHPNLVKYYDSFSIDYRIYLIMEYMPQGDLFDYILANHISEKQAWSIFKQLVNIVKFFDDNGLANLDISCENLMIKSSTEDSIEIVCIDLGATIHNSNEDRNYIQENKDRGHSPGKILYIPRELSVYSPQNKNIDLLQSMVYIVGMTMFKIVMLFEPYLNYEDQWYSYILSGKWLITAKHPSVSSRCDMYSCQLIELIDAMIKPPHERISFKNLFNIVSSR